MLNLQHRCPLLPAHRDNSAHEQRPWLLLDGIGSANGDVKPLTLQNNNHGKRHLDILQQRKGQKVQSKSLPQGACQLLANSASGARRKASNWIQQVPGTFTVFNLRSWLSTSTCPIHWFSSLSIVPCKCVDFFIHWPRGQRSSQAEVQKDATNAVEFPKRLRCCEDAPDWIQWTLAAGGD